MDLGLCGVMRYHRHMTNTATGVYRAETIPTTQLAIGDWIALSVSKHGYVTQKVRVSDIANYGLDKTDHRHRGFLHVNRDMCFDLTGTVQIADRVSSS